MDFDALVHVQQLKTGTGCQTSLDTCRASGAFPWGFLGCASCLHKESDPELHRVPKNHHQLCKSQLGTRSQIFVIKLVTSDLALAKRRELKSFRARR